MSGAAAASAISSLAAAAASAYTGHQQRKLALYMSNTQMQRRVADLRAAGLNPILAAGGPGAGGSVPSVPDPGKAIAAAGVYVQQAKLLREQARLASANADRAEFLNRPFRAGNEVIRDPSVVETWMEKVLPERDNPNSAKEGKVTDELVDRKDRRIKTGHDAWKKKSSESWVDPKVTKPSRRKQSAPKRVPGAEAEVKYSRPKRKKGESAQDYGSRLARWKERMRKEMRQGR